MEFNTVEQVEQWNLEHPDDCHSPYMGILDEEPSVITQEEIVEQAPAEVPVETQNEEVHVEEQCIETQPEPQQTNNVVTVTEPAIVEEEETEVEEQNTEVEAEVTEDLETEAAEMETETEILVDVPQTGDSGTLYWDGLLLLSCFALFCLCVRKHCKIGCRLEGRK